MAKKKQLSDQQIDKVLRKIARVASKNLVNDSMIELFVSTIVDHVMSNQIKPQTYSVGFRRESLEMVNPLHEQNWLTEPSVDDYSSLFFDLETTPEEMEYGGPPKPGTLSASLEPVFSNYFKGIYGAASEECEKAGISVAPVKEQLGEEFEMACDLAVMDYLSEHMPEAEFTADDAVTDVYTAIKYQLKNRPILGAVSQYKPKEKAWVEEQRQFMRQTEEARKAVQGELDKYASEIEKIMSVLGKDSNEMVLRLPTMLLRQMEVNKTGPTAVIEVSKHPVIQSMLDERGRRMLDADLHRWWCESMRPRSPDHTLVDFFWMLDRELLSGQTMNWLVHVEQGNRYVTFSGDNWLFFHSFCLNGGYSDQPDQFNILFRHAPISNDGLSSPRAGSIRTATIEINDGQIVVFSEDDAQLTDREMSQAWDEHPDLGDKTRYAQFADLLPGTNPIYRDQQPH